MVALAMPQTHLNHRTEMIGVYETPQLEKVKMAYRYLTQRYASKQRHLCRGSTAPYYGTALSTQPIVVRSVHGWTARTP